jgi:hypothetical protein
VDECKHTIIDDISELGHKIIVMGVISQATEKLNYKKFDTQDSRGER